MSFVPTLTILNALKAKLEALHWTPPATPQNPDPDPELAFQKVALFDITELDAALEELRVFKSRACFVILDTERFENEISGTKLLVQQRRSVALLITDRDYGRRKDALEGDNTKPGVLVLKDLVLSGEADDPSTSVLGLLAAGVCCQPGFGALMELKDKKRENLAGRICYEQDLELIGGSDEFRLGVGPIR